MRLTAAFLSEEKLSLSHLEMVYGRSAATWSVCTFGLASPSMPHQPIEESGNGVGMETFHFAGPATSKLSLERWVETRVVGWGGADVAD